jgi:hypothetical protein
MGSGKILGLEEGMEGKYKSDVICNTYVGEVYAIRIPVKLLMIQIILRISSEKSNQTSIH